MVPAAVSQDTAATDSATNVEGQEEGGSSCNSRIQCCRCQNEICSICLCAQISNVISNIKYCFVYCFKHISDKDDLSLIKPLSLKSFILKVFTTELISENMYELGT